MVNAAMVNARNAWLKRAHFCDIFRVFGGVKRGVYAGLDIAPGVLLRGEGTLRVTNPG
jgi:hypothetical protein